ncbi:hypothetical protein LTR64_006949 [Lithohypha guttulata]|uniref:uncharacterized protein n=1 Tax=Lithohypha guttulata TaxID=1690604 RepID=UPI002DDF7A6A|nr:hypothetical protein LTR51_004494 [Lithohypha guttulata]
MAPQHVEIAETLTALRKKLRRERDSNQNEPTQFATNRGNKLKPGARYVHAGSLPYRHLRDYKEEINHAGYCRHVLNRNPKRYNGYGDELEDSESDADADADAEEENAYSDVKIEELLRPLTHPSELATHPTLSLPYLDPALPDMVVAADAKIREERNNLWRAKNLYRFFTGDESWVPCERVEETENWALFEPNPGFTEVSGRRLPSGESPGKKRRLSVDNEADDHDVQVADTIDEAFRHTADGLANGTLQDLQDGVRQVAADDERMAEKEQRSNQEDVAMGEAEEQTNGIYTADGQGPETRTNDISTINQVELIVQPYENGLPQDHEPKSDQDMEDDTTAKHEEGVPGENREGARDNDEERPSGASTTPPPPRRITRALAAEADTNSNPQIVSPPPTSPTVSSAPQSPSAFEPHPMFLLPAHFAASHAPHPAYPPLSQSLAHSGLPPEELLETRKLLSLYIQKSEETIRGLEGILGKLIKAKRRREMVWEWCIAEGHVGEMSDGEDWIDCDRWGLQRSELRKGRDEDSGAAEGGNLIVGTEGGDDAPAGVQIGGRKGKRRRVAGKE